MSIIYKIFLSVLSFHSFLIDAQPAEKTIAILNEIDQLYRSNSSHAKITMKIENPNWQRQLSLKIWTKGKDRTLAKILSPKKDKGIASLRIKKEMWNYFPKIKKQIKIPPSMMMGAWMGSDFSNDDLVKQTYLTDSYDVSLNQSKTEYFFTLTPKKTAVSVWTKILIKVRIKDKIPSMYEYFNEKNEVARRLTFSQIKNYSGRNIPSLLVMRPLDKKGHKTTIQYDHVDFDIKLADDFFSFRQLKKSP
ncbi:MAG: outer membrane lipoprotein-sorting protein [Zetaproteobacteria bacterium]|nr:outer membrane lipoprotein-sorting protein [Pseudobdellovibrionaceae bacterium]|tara:strand:+ start:188 stop:931 length:744 start_codon:yes stop_codon:yes gene_type:complete